MFIRTAALFVLATLAVGCADEVPPSESFRHTFVLTDVAIDPTSAIGASIGSDGTLDGLLDALDYLDCDGLVPLVVDVSGTRVGSSGRGQMRLFVTQHVDSATSCDPGAPFLVDPASLDEGGQASTRGPAWLEGPTFEGRLDAGSALGDAVGRLFEDWVRVTGQIHGDPPSVDFGQVQGVWTVDFLYDQLVPETDGLSWLDGATVVYGVQPDVDRDGDGLETFADTDGDMKVDLCIDGDGTRVEGTGCPRDERFSDGFALILVYRVVQAELAGVAETSVVGPLLEFVPGPLGGMDARP